MGAAPPGDLVTGADQTLAELAAAHGVATEFRDWQGRHAAIPQETVIAVLAAMGVEAGTPEARARALEDARLAPWRSTLPPVVVATAGTPAVLRVHCRHGDPVQVRVELEDGGSRTDLLQLMVWVEPLEVDGQLRGEATYQLPQDLPLGWHRIVVRAGAVDAEAPLVVVPRQAPWPAGLDAQAWGWMVQLYSVRSAASWGMGDLGDLAELVRWSGAELGAGLLLCSPLHAAAPVAPMEPSPYYPSTRRFVNPVYLRVEELPEYAAAPAETRAAVDAQRLPPTSDLIDRDAVWAAKRAALELLWPQLTAGRRRAVDGFREREGPGLEQFALWCALAERHGLPWQDWPAALHDPGGPAACAAKEELADRISFYCWLQLLCDEQLAATAEAARDAGMALGVMHDLAVGVDPGGADAWALQDALALGVTVGAPPDGFNQQGQDWQQPPWRPDRLAALGYAPYRDLLRSVLRHAGGLRVDHVLGLFRLWWIPEGHHPADGTYVRYDEEALLGILALEAHRAGAVVVGEDLGTVEPRVRQVLAERGILGSTVLWFEYGADGRPIPPEHWRELSLASVTTHDLPAIAGLLASEHVDLRDRLGLLTRPVEAERSAAEAERDGWLDLLRERGMLAPGAGEEEQIVALHALLARARSRLVLGSLGDAVGERRQQNQPGTVDEHPNWLLPLGIPDDAGGTHPVLLAEICASPRVRRVADALAGRSRPASDQGE